MSVRSLYENISADSPENAVLCTVVSPSPSAFLITEDPFSPGQFKTEGSADDLDPAILASLYAVSSPSLVRIGDREIFAERLGRRPRLVICGGGHVAAALVQSVLPLDFEIWLLEDRPEFAERAQKLGAHHVLCAPFDEAMQQVPDSPDNFYVVMTRGHQYDILCLKKILGERSFAYAGLMASKSRGLTMRETLSEAGIPDEKLACLHSPIGLSIGAQSPAEIAVSITSQLIQTKAAAGKSRWLSDEQASLIADSSPQERLVLCTIIGKSGSTPRAAGTRMLVSEQTVSGTIGGGSVEANVLKICRQMLDGSLPSPQRVRKVLYIDEYAAKGEGCGGQVDLYMERI